jgi:hypothetical protein
MINLQNKFLFIACVGIACFVTSCKSVFTPKDTVREIIPTIALGEQFDRQENSIQEIETIIAPTIIPMLFIDPEEDYYSNLILHDDFEALILWSEFINDYGYGNYFGGGYRINVTAANQAIWVVQGEDIQDSITEISTALMGGSKDNFFGVICRYVDDDNFVMLTISSDGYFAIRKKTSDGEVKFLSTESFLYSAVIREGNQWNKITSDCNHEKLRLYVNNQLVLETVDPFPVKGKTGLIVGNLNDISTEILFDNLYVYDIP